MSLSHDEKQLALSTLLRRDRNDPGAVDLLISLIHNSEYVVRKRAVSLADRFVHHRRTIRLLMEVASCRQEIPTVRYRALDHLEMLFDENCNLPNQPDLTPEFLFDMERSLHAILSNRDEPLNVRGKALELASMFVPPKKLRKWILYFHNRREEYCKLSALSAMGRVPEKSWTRYIHGYLESDRMEYRCAALEAVASNDFEVGRSESSESAATIKPAADRKRENSSGTS